MKNLKHKLKSSISSDEYDDIMDKLETEKVVKNKKGGSLIDDDSWYDIQSDTVKEEIDKEIVNQLSSKTWKINKKQ